MISLIEQKLRQSLKKSFIILLEINGVRKTILKKSLANTNFSINTRRKKY